MTNQKRLEEKNRRLCSLLAKATYLLSICDCKRDTIPKFISEAQEELPPSLLSKDQTSSLRELLRQDPVLLVAMKEQIKEFER